MTEKRKAALTLVVILVRALACIVLLAAAIAVFSALYTTRPQAARTDRADLAPRVMVMAARPVEVFRQWRGFGTARPLDSADVPARVTATVLEVPDAVTAGRAVAAGGLLVRLDETDFTRQVEIATHSIADIDAQLERMVVEERSWRERVSLAGQQVELARAEFDRARAAQDLGSARPREVDAAKQALISAIRDETVAREEYDKLSPRRRSLEAQRLGIEAERRLAATNVARCRITSPIAGVLQEVDVEVGESLVSGQRVARVVDLGRIEVPVRLPSSARSSVRVGDGVDLALTGTDVRTWTTKVAHIAPEDDQATRTMTVFVEVGQDPQAPGGLAPGQFVEAIVTCSEARPRWVIPRRSVDRDRMLIVTDNRIESRRVEVDYQIDTRLPQLGVPDREWIVLRDPLPDGAMVVVTPKRALADGMPVQTVIAGDATHAAGDRSGGAAAGGEPLR